MRARKREMVKDERFEEKREKWKERKRKDDR